MSAIYEDIRKLCEEGVIGFYKGLEVTTVFGYDKVSKTVFNVITLVVAVEIGIDANQEPVILNDDRIEIGKDKNKFFGIQQFYINFDSFYDNINNLINNQIWQASGNDLFTGKMMDVGRKFAPSDSFIIVPTNNIIKNNFFSGSYIYEWFDIDKRYVDFLFEEPRLLQELSTKISQYLPIKIASLSDKLGNLILQLPITVIYSKISHKKDNANLEVNIEWNIKTKKKRDLQLFLIKENDFVYPDFKSINIKEGVVELDMSHEGFSHKYFIWDTENSLLLFATSESSFISSIGLESSLIEPEPRVFNNSMQDEGQERVVLSSSKLSNISHENYSTKTIWEFQSSRIFEKERNELLNAKEFIQYRKGDEERALQDLRELINKFGREGVWIWDPFLSNTDILNTLFFNAHSNSSMKAITNLTQFKAPKKWVYVQRMQAIGSNVYIIENLFLAKIIRTKKDLMNHYSYMLQRNSGNRQSLNIEFRTRYEGYGWKFHDRFIIFPSNRKRAMAWSLGTSINSLGQSHHIFQKVSHGQLIADAFDELWQELNNEESLIWKS